jgi:serine/threonine-protein kinase
MELPTGQKITEDFMATRFIDNGDGTVTDGETNLVWQKDQAPERMTWPEAQQYVDQLNAKSFAGHNDWRLPTNEELLTLMLSKENKKRLFLDPIFGSQRCYWSADTRNHHVACYVDYYYGGVYQFQENYVNHSVRAVRGPIKEDVAYEQAS